MTDAEAEIADGRQRLVRRNWRFSLLPGVILALLLVVLGWEILRQNMGPTEWPWSITILGIAPAATLCGVFASLLLAREQFARSMRPNLLWSTEFRQSEVLGQPAWTIHLLNVGPALAHVDAITYTVVVTGPTGVVVRKAVSHGEAVRLLDQCGLVPDRDYHLELITPGAPLSVVKQLSEGIEFGAFTEAAVARLRQLNFAITVVDTMGDRHQKSLPFLATLPERARPGRRAFSPATAESNPPSPILPPTTEVSMETPTTDPTLTAPTAAEPAPEPAIANPHLRELVNTRANLNDQTRPSPFKAYGKN